MPRRAANELAAMSAVIDAEVEGLLREAALKARKLERRGLYDAAQMFRRQAVEIVSNFVEEAMREARRTSPPVGALLDDIARELNAA